MGVVQLFKALAIAGWATVFAVSFAQAQPLAGPAELPPSGFKGSQYVDSRGCVFLRAGIGGRVNWVPRISRDRKALCGQTPAAAAREVTAVQAPVVAPPKVVAPVAPRPKRTAGNVGKPMETIASKRYVTKPAAPVASVQAKTAPQHSKCPAASPYGVLVTLADGHRSLLCSSDAGFDVLAAQSRLEAKRSGFAPSTQQTASNEGSGYTPKASYLPEKDYLGRGYVCPASAPVARRFALNGGGTTVRCTAVSGGLYSETGSMADESQAQTMPNVPKGYRRAWKDDRLNPNRGKGTALGQAQQDQIWTRDVPAKPIAAAIERRVYLTSASNTPPDAKFGQATHTSGSYYVQVGTFGEAANVTRTAARLRGLGLPVAKSRITSKGKQLQIVMAGPFGDAGAAKAALSAARRSGFGDAFIR